MTEPTRKQIISAYEALETLTNTCTHSIDLAEELQELVLRALPPRPRPTMADLEWDDDKHYMAEAEQNLYGNVIMLGVDDTNMNMIAFLVPPDFGKGIDAAFHETLTPTGRRYTLTEVQDD